MRKNAESENIFAQQIAELRQKISAYDASMLSDAKIVFESFDEEAFRADSRPRELVFDWHKVDYWVTLHQGKITVTAAYPEKNVPADQKTFTDIFAFLLELRKLTRQLETESRTIRWQFLHSLKDVDRLDTVTQTHIFRALQTTLNNELSKKNR